MSNGKLILIPTPIDEASGLEPKTLSLLNECVMKPSTVLLVEEVKEGRRAWLRFGLPREAIEKMIEFNEHTVTEQSKNIQADLKNGKTVLLMSDCGTPAWMDPGQELVNWCHQNQVKVTATSLNNSMALAIALSGLPHHEFHFFGFPPKSDREKFWEKVFKNNCTSVVMDTPYRLSKVISEMKESALKHNKNKTVFLGMNLNAADEELIRMPILDFPAMEGKKEFILVIGA